MRKNRPIKAAEPRHRKAGPARLGGEAAGGKRAREVTDEENVEQSSGETAEGQEDATWPRIASRR